MNIQSLFHPEQWLEMKVADVLVCMKEAGIGKLQMSLAAEDKAVFALVLIHGEDTPALLQAIATKSDELEALATSGNAG